jgi:hypothetical protein
MPDQKGVTMSRQYVLELVVDLPDDPHQMSDVIGKTAEPVNNLKAALEAGSVPYDLQSGFRSKRKPRGAGLPGTVLAETPQAA